MAKFKSSDHWLFAIEKWRDSKAATAGYLRLSNGVIQKQ
jgi:hypothetical protein